MPIVFIEAELGDASDFHHNPLMEVTQEEGRFIISVNAVRLDRARHRGPRAWSCRKVGKPPEIHFGWSDESPHGGQPRLSAVRRRQRALDGRELIRRAEPDPDKPAESDHRLRRIRRSKRPSCGMPSLRHCRSRQFGSQGPV